MTEPIHILSLGAGVQSSTLALMAAHGEVTPLPKCAIFSDTQDEPASVMEWLDTLESLINSAPFPFPIYRVTAGRLSARALEMRTTKDGRRFTKTDIPFHTRNADGSIGMIRRRACTRDFKLTPLFKRQRIEGCVPRKTKVHRVHVISWVGISLDEVTRMKPSREWWSENRWPLIERRMNRHDCLRWMESKGYPTPPRSACVFCPYHSNFEWKRLKEDEPAAFEKAVQFEKAVLAQKKDSQNFKSTPFLHKSCKPLNEVDFSTDIDRGQIEIAFGNECEGMCGV